MNERLFTDELLASVRPLSEAPTEWQQIYLATFRKQLEPAHLLWVWYHGKTESYDRTVCSYRDKNGCAIPHFPGERELCNENARYSMKIVELAASMLGISHGELVDARMVGRMFDDPDHCLKLLQVMDSKVRTAIEHATDRVAKS